MSLHRRPLVPPLSWPRSDGCPMDPMHVIPHPVPTDVPPVVAPAAGDMQQHHMVSSWWNKKGLRCPYYKKGY